MKVVDGDRLFAVSLQKLKKCQQELMKIYESFSRNKHKELTYNEQQIHKFDRYLTTTTATAAAAAAAAAAAMCCYVWRIVGICVCVQNADNSAGRQSVIAL